MRRYLTAQNSTYQEAYSAYLKIGSRKGDGPAFTDLEYAVTHPNRLQVGRTARPAAPWAAPASCEIRVPAVVLPRRAQPQVVLLLAHLLQ